MGMYVYTCSWDFAIISPGSFKIVNVKVMPIRRPHKTGTAFFQPGRHFYWLVEDTFSGRWGGVGLAYQSCETRPHVGAKSACVRHCGGGLSYE